MRNVDPSLASERETGGARAGRLIPLAVVALSVALVFRLIGYLGSDTYFDRALANASWAVADVSVLWNLLTVMFLTINLTAAAYYLFLALEDLLAFERIFGSAGVPPRSDAPILYRLLSRVFVEIALFTIASVIWAAHSIGAQVIATEDQWTWTAIPANILIVVLVIYAALIWTILAAPLIRLHRRMVTANHRTRPPILDSDTEIVAMIDVDSADGSVIDRLVATNFARRVHQRERPTWPLPLRQIGSGFATLAAPAVGLIIAAWQAFSA